MNKKSVIEKLQLQYHIEGGYFRRTYASSHTLTIDGIPKSERVAMSSIYFGLVSEAVTPGFAPQDRELATLNEIHQNHRKKLEQYIQPH